ncbi:MAG: hypothetical protein Ta2A_01600 [Treponemataceae bacterium]|nr:MAG: hypothetical protein Ta2A_01600 [Treponemataceae bacterium]
MCYSLEKALLSMVRLVLRRTYAKAAAHVLCGFYHIFLEGSYEKLQI